MARGCGIETEFDSETLSKEKYEELFGPKPDGIACKEKTKWETAAVSWSVHANQFSKMNIMKGNGLSVRCVKD